MIPLFFSANPHSILVRGKPYRFVCFLVYREDDSEQFARQLRRQYRDLHVSTGADCAVVDFSFPPREWLETYLGWFLSRYELIDASNEMRAARDLLGDEGIRAYELLAETYEQEKGWETIVQRDNFMRLMNLKPADLPAMVVFDQKNPQLFGRLLKTDMEKMALAAEQLVSTKSIELTLSVECVPLQKPIPFAEIASLVANPLSKSFARVCDIVTSAAALKQQSEMHIEPLIAEYPEFKSLENPKAFSWRPMLKKCLDKHRNQVGRYVEKLNFLETNPKMDGLGLERIGSFWRFRISDFFRAHYHLIDGQRIHYFVGEHDYQL